MTDRVVKVSLIAQVSNYVSGFEQVRKANVAAGSAADQARAKFEAQTQAMQQVGTGLMAIGAIAAVGVGLAIKKFADFDAAMSEVQASTHESAENMGLLRDAAIEAGASTVFTATEAANAIDELSKAGVSAADVLGGALAGSLDLASAGGLGVADAASIAATALTQFKLEGKDIPHVADLLAAGAGKAQGSVQDLGAALAQGGLVASQAGMSLDETTGVLAAFASAGLIGSDAGTSLKTMLLALEKPSGKAAELMEKYNISVYDAQGKMLGMSAIAGQLENGLGSLSDEERNFALATIFGTDAVRSASVMFDQGAKGISAWNDKVADSGYAAETARIKLDNLNGDVEKLGGAFDTALIKGGSASDLVLRGLVQTVTALVDVFNGAPLGVQQVALALGAVAAAAALTGGAFLLGVPKIAQFQVALATLAASEMPAVAASALRMQGAVVKSGAALATTAKFLTGPWGAALAAAAVGVALLGQYLESLRASSEEVSNSMKTATSAAEIFNKVGEGREWTALADVKAQLNDLPWLLQESAEQSENMWARFGAEGSFGALQALKDVGTELAKTAGSDLPEAQREFRLLAKETDGTAQSQWRLLSSMPAYKDALTEQATELGINVTSTNEAANKTALLGIAFGDATPTALDAADAYLAAADEASGLNEQVAALMESINLANGVGQDAVSANAAYQDSLAGITEEVEKQKEEFIKLQEDAYKAANGTLDGFVGTLDGFTLSLDESTAAGSANASMLSDVAADAQAAAEAVYEQDLKTMSAKDAADKYSATLATSRDALAEQAAASGFSADEVQRLIDKVYALPTQAQTQILAETADAAAKIQHIQDLLNGIGGTMTSHIAIDGSGGMTRAEGGSVYGPGTSTSDSIPVWLSNGEEVTRTAMAEKHRPLLKAINADRLDEYFRSASRHANGGTVGYATQPQYVQSGHTYGGNSSSVTKKSISNTFNVTDGPSANELAEAVLAKQNYQERSW